MASKKKSSLTCNVHNSLFLVLWKTVLSSPGSNLIFHLPNHPGHVSYHIHHIACRQFPFLFIFLILVATVSKILSVCIFVEIALDSCINIVQFIVVSAVEGLHWSEDPGYTYNCDLKISMDSKSRNLYCGVWRLWTFSGKYKTVFGVLFLKSRTF